MINWGFKITMKLPRRKFLPLTAGAVAFPFLLRFASASDYPTRPVHLIAGFPPGGVVDMMARMIGHALSVNDLRRSLAGGRRPNCSPATRRGAAR
jgi:hypothetical protein